MACLESHRPLDLVTLMLGTNDLKARFGSSASDIAQGAASLADMMLRSGCGPDGGAPVVLLISPPAVATLTDMAQMFEGAERNPGSSRALRAIRRAARVRVLRRLPGHRLQRRRRHPPRRRRAQKLGVPSLPAEEILG